MASASMTSDVPVVDGLGEGQELVQSGEVVQSEGSRHGVEADAFVDGRTTPTPESESANFLSRNPSFQSQPTSASAAAATAVDAPSRPTSAQPVPDRQNGTPAPSTTIKLSKAEVGFGALSGEQQLRTSLQTKDRLFLLVLAKEVEAFLVKVQSGDMPNIIPSVPLATTSTSALATMTASFIVGSRASSTFQRMLVYKLADWYGVRAVHTPEVGMIIGLVGVFDPASVSLRLADLAPKADSPPPKIKLMRRNQPGQSANGLSRPGSTGPSATTSETDSNRSKTLEEREEAYAKARQRIYGPEGESLSALDTPDPQQPVGGRQSEVGDDDFETAPRTSTAVRQPSTGRYAPMNDPPRGRKSTGPPPAPSTSLAHGNGHGFGQQQPYNLQYPMQQPQQQQQQVPMQYPQYGPGPQAQLNQYPPQNYGYQPQPQGQSYNPMSNGPYMHMGMGGMNTMYPPQQPQGYQNQWQQMPGGATSPGYGQMPQMQHNNRLPQMQQPQGQGWPGPNQVNMQQQQQLQHQPMPMIPQGMQPAYGYPNQQQGGFSHLVQPTPMRPPPHPHSSASSSISSMSYHSWHDISRPHSRGSTTSNMSATSSVRFGAMYPANQQTGRYQPKGLQGPGIGGGSSGSRPGPSARKGSGSLNDSRSTRPHSPASVGTASSQSSRRAGSISLAPPSQHPLPQRPDWAANNVPYHPSAIVTHPHPAQISGGGGPAPSSNDFPPLRQHGLAGTQAEPMQVERVKMRPSNGTVWNGSSKTLAADSPSSSPRASVSQPPAPLSPIIPIVSAVPAPAPAPPVAETTFTMSVSMSGGGAEDDPDFPRRAPSMNSSQTLYDPSATSSSRPESTKPVNINVNPIANPVNAEVAVESAATAPGMIPEDIIEAKLAEVSLREGVEIGPPPSKTHGPAPSYAKIVRRD